MKNRAILIASALMSTTAVLFAAPAITNNRVQKIEVYRAFVSSYAEGNAVNLSNVTHRFDATSEAIIACAPSAFVTTAISRHFRTQSFAQSDFPEDSVRIVDPGVQIALMRAHDPSATIAEGSDVDDAVGAAFAAGLLQVSDIGFDISGQHALLTYSFSCGSLCGHGGTALFDRVGDRWVWSQRSCGPEWMS